MQYRLQYQPAVQEGISCCLAYEKLANTGVFPDLKSIPLKPAVYEEMDLIWRNNSVLSPLSEFFLSRMEQMVEENRNTIQENE